MITIGMNYDVLPGKQPEFESAVQGVMNALGKAAGHARSLLYRDCAQDNSYLIMSEWTDEAAFHSFVGSEAFRNVANWGASNILSGRPRHQLYR